MWPSHLAPDFLQRVLFVDEDHRWLVVSDACLGIKAEGSNYHKISRSNQMCSSTVHAYLMRTRQSANGVGFKPIPIGNVPDADRLKLGEIRLLKEFRWQGDASLIVEVGIGYRRPMNLRPQ